MTRRMIVSEMWEDDFFVGLNYLDRLIWIGLITAVADDQGRFQDNINLIRSRIFPMDNFDPRGIEETLVLFNNAFKIVRYTVDNKHAIQIVSWWKHQTPQWAGKSVLKPPEHWTDRERYHGKENRIHTLNWDLPGGYEESYIAHYEAHYSINDVNVNVKADFKAEDKGLPPLPSIFKLYESEIGMITPMIADCLQLWEKEYPAEWFQPAIKEAIEHNARNYKYIDQILKRWKVQGFQSNTKAPVVKKSNPERNLEAAQKFIGGLDNGK